MEPMGPRRLALSGAVFLLASFLVAATASAVENTGTAAAIDAATRKQVLDELARTLESQYAVEATGKQLAELVRTKKRTDAYRRIKEGPELARALTDDLFAVAHDKHLRVFFSFVPLPKDLPASPTPDMLSAMLRANGLIPKLEILDGNVGYMRVNGVPPLESARAAVSAAFAFLHNTDALIIDNRGNGGGDPNTVALYVSYLSEGKSYLVNTFHWRTNHQVEEFVTTELGELTYGAHKPVYILTSQETFSGGEELAYDLQALKRAVVVGEVTGGGANPGGPVSLGHQFGVNVPRGQAFNPITGKNWEGVGVQPDVAVPAATALSKAHTLAIDQLMAKASDPQSQSKLRALVMKLQTTEEAASGHATRLPNTDLLGTYAPEAGAGATLTILENDGRLIRHLPGFPDRALIYLNGNRYRPEGLPEGFVISFRLNQGKTELLLEEPAGPSVIRVKQLP